MAADDLLDVHSGVGLLSAAVTASPAAWRGGITGGAGCDDGDIGAGTAGADHLWRTDALGRLHDYRRAGGAASFARAEAPASVAGSGDAVVCLAVADSQWLCGAGQLVSADDSEFLVRQSGDDVFGLAVTGFLFGRLFPVVPLAVFIYCGLLFVCHCSALPLAAAIGQKPVPLSGMGWTAQSVDLSPASASDLRAFASVFSKLKRCDALKLAHKNTVHLLLPATKKLTVFCGFSLKKH